MYTYFFLEDDDTTYRIKFFIKENEKEKFLSLVGIYLEEIVFIEENEIKKLVEKDKIDEENKEKIYNDDGVLFLERTEVIKTEEIEDYLPYIVTLKTTKYRFLRSYSIRLLISTFSDDIATDDARITSLLKMREISYIDFDDLRRFFFDEEGNFKKEGYYDYKSVCTFFDEVSIKITDIFSIKELAHSYWQDDMDREFIETVPKDTILNKQALKVLDFNLGERLKNYNK